MVNVHQIMVVYTLHYTCFSFHQNYAFIQVGSILLKKELGEKGDCHLFQTFIENSHNKHSS